MKTYRVIAALLALVMLLGMFSGCSKNRGETTDPANPSNNPGTKTETNDEKAASTSKYAYQAEYLPIPENIQYVNTSTISGSNLYFTGSIIDGKKTYTDENGEETEYDNYRSALFKMDVETGDCTELTEFQLPEVPEGWMGSTDLNTIQAGADGTLWAIYGSYTYRYNPPADLAEDDSMYNYYEEGENKTGLLHLDADGKEIKRIEFSQTDEDGNSFYVSSFFVDNSGNVYLSDWQNVYIYDQDGNKKTTVDLGENGGDLCELKAGVVGVSYYKNDEAKPEESGRVFQEIDPATGKLTGDTVKLPDVAYSFFPGDDVYDIYYDYNGNIYGYKFDTDTKDKVIDWIECDINSNNLNSYSILPDGRVIAFESSYDDQAQKNNMQLIVMTRVDAASVVNKTVLTFACMYLDWNRRDAIVKFNRASNTHRIVVRDYSEYNTDDDYNAGIQKLNTEMLSGKLPDMIDINTYSMPVEQYAAKGFLTDLYELIDADADLSREDFVQPVLKALESADGKLYQLPSTFAVSTAIALDKVAGDYDTWNLAAVKDAMTKLQDGASVFDVYRTKSDILQTCISRNIDAFVDWENGSAHFDSDEFKALLEFANQFPETYDWENATDEENDSAQNRMNSGKQLMTDMYVSSFEDMLYQLTGYNGGVKFVGYPSEDGTSNHTFQIDGSIAISSTCADKTAAWNFMKQFLTEDYQSGSNVWNFPINQKAFDQKMKDAMTEEYQTDENGKPTTQTSDEAGYFDLGPLDHGESTRREICMALEQMGFEIEASHHEVAQGQHEIDFKYAPALECADKIMTFKLAVKSLAQKNGLHATFMPKPVSGAAGSGMHVNMSLFRDGKNAFYDEADPRHLSPLAYQFIAGLLGHVRGCCAVTNPLVNSYKRLVPGYEAPCHLAWSTGNRSALVRIPTPRGNSTRVELRSPDPACNPYLALAACLAAGLDGIEQQMTPPAPLTGNLYEVGDASGIQRLPGSLEEAVRALEADSVITDALGAHVTEQYLAGKRRECRSYAAQVSQWELEQYLVAY